MTAQHLIALQQGMTKQANHSSPAATSPHLSARAQGLLQELVTGGMGKFASAMGAAVKALPKPGANPVQMAQKGLGAGTMNMLKSTPAIKGTTAQSIADSAVKRGDKKTLAMFI